jgi:hypothetical protein
LFMSALTQWLAFVSHADAIKAHAFIIPLSDESVKDLFVSHPCLHVQKRIHFEGHEKVRSNNYRHLEGRDTFYTFLYPVE